jgi:hypothetical protein
MRRIWAILLVMMAAMSALAADFELNLLAGTKGGASVKVGGMVTDFAKGFPLGLEGSVSYSWRDPGNAYDARRIFVNDNTNGTPEKSGYFWDLRLDLLHRVRALGMENLYLLGGARYSMFVGHFEYIGGNEDFDVTSNQFGLGLGARASFPMGSRIALTVLAGVDYYFPASLEGHDTIYRPDDENVNSKHDYTYATADEAINQLGVVPLLMIGLSFTL